MKRGREYHGCGEEYNLVKRDRGSNISYDIEAAWKNIKWEKGQRGRKWPDKSTTGYDKLDFKSYTKNLYITLKSNISSLVVDLSAHFEKENQNLKEYRKGRISSCRELYTPLP